MEGQGEIRHIAGQFRIRRLDQIPEPPAALAGLAVVDHHRDDQRQAAHTTPLVLFAIEFPDFNHVAQQLQGHEPVGAAFVLEQEVHEPLFIVR